MIAPCKGSGRLVGGYMFTDVKQPCPMCGRLLKPRRRRKGDGFLYAPRHLPSRTAP